MKNVSTHSIINASEGKSTEYCEIEIVNNWSGLNPINNNYHSWKILWKKVRKCITCHFCHKGQKNYLAAVLAQIIKQMYENFLFDCFIQTQSEVLVGNFSNKKIQRICWTKPCY
jgi:hypothetical protein